MKKIISLLRYKISSDGEFRKALKQELSKAAAAKSSYELAMTFRLQFPRNFKPKFSMKYLDKEKKKLALLTVRVPKSKVSSKRDLSEEVNQILKKIKAPASKLQLRKITPVGKTHWQAELSPTRYNR